MPLLPEKEVEGMSSGCNTYCCNTGVRIFINKQHTYDETIVNHVKNFAIRGEVP